MGARDTRVEESRVGDLIPLAEGPCAITRIEPGADRLTFYLDRRDPITISHGAMLYRLEPENGRVMMIVPARDVDPGDDYLEVTGVGRVLYVSRTPEYVVLKFAEQNEVQCRPDTCVRIARMKRETYRTAWERLGSERD